MALLCQSQALTKGDLHRADMSSSSHVIKQHLLYAARSAPLYEASDAANACAGFFLFCFFWRFVLMFHMCREVRHRWFRSAVVRPTLRAEGWGKQSRWGPWRVLLLHACALLYGFNYRLWTQTDLFILLRSIHWGLVGTTNTRATHTHTHTHRQTHTRAHTRRFVVVKVSILDSAAGCTCQLSESLVFHVH